MFCCIAGVKFVIYIQINVHMCYTNYYWKDIFIQIYINLLIVIWWIIIYNFKCNWLVYIYVASTTSRLSIFRYNMIVRNMDYILIIKPSFLNSHYMGYISWFIIINQILYKIVSMSVEALCIPLYHISSVSHTDVFFNNSRMLLAVTDWIFRKVFAALMTSSVLWDTVVWRSKLVTMKIISAIL